jgi:hypothetical protein
MFHNSFSPCFFFSFLFCALSFVIEQIDNKDANTQQIPCMHILAIAGLRTITPELSELPYVNTHLC